MDIFPPAQIQNEDSDGPTLQMTYELIEYAPVYEDTTEADVTKSNLGILNNLAAVTMAALPYVNTLDGITKVTASMCKIIETQRKCKKLSFGQVQSGGSKLSDFVLE